MTTKNGHGTWTFLFKAPGGARYFKDATGRIATCDDSVNEPMSPVFYVETDKPVLIGQVNASVPVRSESGELFSVLESARGGILVAERLGMGIRVGERTFVLSEVIAVKKAPSVLLAGPEIGGDNTVPFRVVLLRWPDGEFSVHRQSHNGAEWSLEDFSDGDYFKYLPPAQTKFQARSGEMGFNPGLARALRPYLNELPLCLLTQMLVLAEGTSLDAFIEMAMSPTHDPKRKTL